MTPNSHFFKIPSKPPLFSLWWVVIRPYKQAIIKLQVTLFIRAYNGLPVVKNRWFERGYKQLAFIEKLYLYGIKNPDSFYFCG